MAGIKGMKRIARNPISFYFIIIISLSEHTLGNDKLLSYNLCAVSNHHGILMEDTTQAITSLLQGKFGTSVMTKSSQALVSLAFSASIGLMFLILACALPDYNNWWPFFVLIFYVLAPIPSLMARRMSEDSGGSNPCKELAYFLTAGLVVSAFGLPIVLARSPPGAPVIEWGACSLVLAGNVVTFLTIWGFFVMADSDDVEYSMW